MSEGAPEEVLTKIFFVFDVRILVILDYDWNSVLLISSMARSALFAFVSPTY